MMDLTGTAIANSRVTLVALAVIVAGGLAAYGGMSRAEDPGFIIRTAQVMTLFPGASPERVGEPGHGQARGGDPGDPRARLRDLDLQDRVSIILVNVREEFMEMRPIWDDLRRKVDRARSDLPADVIGPTVNDEFGDVFGVIVTVTGEGYSYAELEVVAEEVRDELLRVGDVAKVDIYGAQDERVFVDYDNARLAELGLSPLQLRQILDSANIIIPGGDVSTGVERITLEPSGNFESVEDLRQAVVTLPGRPEILYLEDLATITRGYVDPPGAWCARRASRRSRSPSPCATAATSSRSARTSGPSSNGCRRSTPSGSTSTWSRFSRRWWSARSPSSSTTCSRRWVSCSGSCSCSSAFAPASSWRAWCRPP